MRLSYRTTVVRLRVYKADSVEPLLLILSPSATFMGISC